MLADVAPIISRKLRNILIVKEYCTLIVASLTIEIATQ